MVVNDIIDTVKKDDNVNITNLSGGIKTNAVIYFQTLYIADIGNTHSCFGVFIVRGQ